MNSVQTQTLSINGDGGGEAYIDFCDGQFMCFSCHRRETGRFSL